MTLRDLLTDVNESTSSDYIFKLTQINEFIENISEEDNLLLLEQYKSIIFREFTPNVEYCSAILRFLYLFYTKIEMNEEIVLYFAKFLLNMVKSLSLLQISDDKIFWKDSQLLLKNIVNNGDSISSIIINLFDIEQYLGDTNYFLAVLVCIFTACFNKISSFPLIEFIKVLEKRINSVTEYLIENGEGKAQHLQLLKYKAKINYRLYLIQLESLPFVYSDLLLSLTLWRIRMPKLKNYNTICMSLLHISSDSIHSIIKPSSISYNDEQYEGLLSILVERSMESYAKERLEIIFSTLDKYPIFIVKFPTLSSDIIFLMSKLDNLSHFFPIYFTSLSSKKLFPFLSIIFFHILNRSENTSAIIYALILYIINTTEEVSLNAIRLLEIIMAKYKNIVIDIVQEYLPIYEVYRYKCFNNLVSIIPWSESNILTKTLSNIYLISPELLPLFSLSSCEPSIPFSNLLTDNIHVQILNKLYKRFSYTNDSKVKLKIVNLILKVQNKMCHSFLLFNLYQNINDLPVFTNLFNNAFYSNDELESCLASYCLKRSTIGSKSITLKTPLSPQLIQQIIPENTREMVARDLHTLKN